MFNGGFSIIVSIAELTLRKFRALIDQFSQLPWTDDAVAATPQGSQQIREAISQSSTHAVWRRRNIGLKATRPWNERALPSGYDWHSYGKWPFIVDFPIENGDFP